MLAWEEVRLRRWRLELWEEVFDEVLNEVSGGSMSMMKEASLWSENTFGENSFRAAAEEEEEVEWRGDEEEEEEDDEEKEEEDEVLNEVM